MLKLRCGAARNGEHIQPFAKFYPKLEILFLTDVSLGVAFPTLPFGTDAKQSRSLAISLLFREELTKYLAKRGLEPNLDTSWPFAESCTSVRSRFRLRSSVLNYSVTNRQSILKSISCRNKKDREFLLTSLARKPVGYVGTPTSFDTAHGAASSKILGSDEVLLTQQKWTFDEKKNQLACTARTNLNNSDCSAYW